MLAYRLAARIGEYNIDKILNDLTLYDLLEWGAFDELENYTPPPSQEDMVSALMRAYK